MADFSLVPDYMFEQKPQYKTLISNFENGAEQRRSKRSSAITEYKLVYKNRGTTDIGIINALFTAKKGAALSFTWLHPISGVTLTVRFKEDSLNLVYTNYGSYDVEFTLTNIL